MDYLTHNYVMFLYKLFADLMLNLHAIKQKVTEIAYCVNKSLAALPDSNLDRLCKLKPLVLS